MKVKEKPISEHFLAKALDGLLDSFCPGIRNTSSKSGTYTIFDGAIKAPFTAQHRYSLLLILSSLQIICISRMTNIAAMQKVTTS